MCAFPCRNAWAKVWAVVFILVIGSLLLKGQQPLLLDTVPLKEIPAGWADEAVSIGYVTAPSVLVLMFVSGLVNEWNAGYFGIPASAMIFAAPPVIFLGGRSAGTGREEYRSRAKLGWTLYALSIIPTAFALYSYTTDWGAAVPLIISSGILGSASIIAMTSYASSRKESAANRKHMAAVSWNVSLAPLRKGAMLMLSYRF